MRYRLSYTEEARRAIPDLPGNYRQRIRREIAALADNPRPAYAERFLAELMHQYERNMLVRAEAAFSLRQRGL